MTTPEELRPIEQSSQQAEVTDSQPQQMNAGEVYPIMVDIAAATGYHELIGSFGEKIIYPRHQGDY